ncbi:MAG TPA: heavy-metal-associated domain-containing protein [Marinilabiliaceae bacterium]|nr:heavy-metal-associated domain-containing protein [Marinilabiliaceae bacterium]
MKVYQFKTNINCGGCIKAVTPFLDKAEKIEKWNVDVTSSDKLLTVETDSLSADEVRSIVESAGYSAHLK